MPRPVTLALRALGLGELFTGLPALTLLRRALPEDRIVLALPPVLWPLARLSGLVDDTVAAHELSPIVRPPRRPDLAVDLHGKGPESIALLAASEPREVIAFAAGSTDWRAGEHEVHRWCRLVAAGLGLAGVPFPPVAGSLAAVPDEQVPVGRTVIHCGAGAPARRWPPDRFAAVAARLRTERPDVTVVGGADERDIAAVIAGAARVELAPPLSVTELVALIAHARLVICGDTGPAHVASNYRTPSVVLFGPNSPAVCGPPRDPVHQSIWHGAVSGNPHARRPDPALLAVGVDEVVTAAERALARAEDVMA